MSRIAIGVAALATALSCAAQTAPTTDSASSADTDTSSTVSTQWATVSGPALPSKICATLSATLTPIAGSVDALDGSPTNSQPDAKRIQAAINACPTGQAVRLTPGSSGESGFLSGPIQLKSGVTLWIDKGATLFASRNPADYDNGRGTCGTATKSDEKSCNPLILAKSTVGSGIVGDGTIDGRGGSLLTHGPNAGKRTWWDVAYQNKTSGLNQQNPRLVQVTNGSSFTLYRITLENSPNFHVVTDGVKNVTAWSIKILSPSLVYTKPGYACPSGTTPDVVTPATCFTPDTAKNTDGFDPGQSSNVLLAYSYISTGDDDVAIKASDSPGSSNLTFAHNHFYYGHGMSIGSETNAGVRNVAVTDLTMDGYDSPNGNGLRIKSDASSGGSVNGVLYSQVCMRNEKQPLVFDPYYSSSKGSDYPSFTGIVVSGFHDLGSNAYGGGEMTFSGFAKGSTVKPLGITLDNVVFDGTQPTLAKASLGDPFETKFTMGPGPVSFSNAIVTSSSNGVSIMGSPGNVAPIDCSAAFVPLSTVVPASPI